MNEPIIEKFPTEVFGCPYTGKKRKWSSVVQKQHCKFIEEACTKPRKNDKDIKVGICSVGYKCNSNDKHTPVIICPERFEIETIFKTIKKRFLSGWKKVEWIPEVDLGVGGSVDYVAIGKNRKGDNDFLCVEIQACGTTRSPFPAVEDLKEYGEYKKQSYNYGLNWANEFSKTMMQQAYKKGKIIDHWKRKIVFVVQDVAIDYLKSAVDTHGLVPYYKPTFPIHFCTFSLKWNKNKWDLKFSKIYSTNLNGVIKMLSGADIKNCPTKEKFISNIIKKGIKDGVLEKEDYCF